MAEALLSEDNNDWGAEMDAVRPVEEEKPHSGVWEDEVLSRLREDLIMQVEVVGEAQVTATVESTEDLAVSPEQVKTTFFCYNQTSV